MKSTVVIIFFILAATIGCQPKYKMDMVVIGRQQRVDIKVPE
jgi:hypothetical protein